MRAVLKVDPADAVPIWHQIEDGMRRLVASRTLKPGMSVPSVRELARDLQVNPATVSKAYQRLVEAGLLVVQRGEGTFVAEEAPAFRARDRRMLLEEAALRYLTVVRTAGASRAESDQALERAWSAMNPEPEASR